MSPGARRLAATLSPSRGFHVALDLDLARRAPGLPEAVLINGFLLFDCGGYDLCTARLPEPLFWRMKALDLLGRDGADLPQDETGIPPATVWQVEATLGGTVLGHLAAWNRDCGFDDGAARGGTPPGTGADRIHRLEIERVIALDRVWIGRRGLRLCATVLAASLLPEPPE